MRLKASKDIAPSFLSLMLLHCFAPARALQDLFALVAAVRKLFTLTCR